MIDYKEYPNPNHDQVMDNAKEALSGKWGMAAVAMLLYFAIALSANFIPGASFFIGGPFALGLAIFFMNIARRKESRVENIFEGFKNFVYALGTYLIMIFIIVAVMFLAFIPIGAVAFVFQDMLGNDPSPLAIVAIVLVSIIAVLPVAIFSLGFSQCMFILADHPKMSPDKVLKESWNMMKGRKRDYFVLNLRFFGWAILCLFTLGIGYLWLMPYMQVTYANYYDEISGAKNTIEDEFHDDISRHLVD